jgi:hypothetical protein
MATDRSLAAGVLLLAAASAGTAPPGAPVVTGGARAEYRLPEPGTVPSYVNQGFRQEPDADRLVVQVAANGDWTRAGFDRSALPPPCGPVAVFARNAAGAAQTRAEAVARVVQAVAATIAYRPGSDLPVRPDEVLARREAHCVGLANLAAEALNTLAIPARIARGVLIHRATGAAVAHRWIEVFYPDAGWVFSDPTESVNYVSAYHVVLTPPGDPDPSYDPRDARRVAPRLIAAEDALLAVDLRPGRSGGLGERRVRAEQYRAAVVGRVLPPRAGSVRLSGAGQVWERQVTAGDSFSFPGLEAGQYAIEARFGDSVKRIGLSIVDAQVVEVEVKLK